MVSSDSHHTPIKGVYRPGLSSIDRLKKTAVGQQEIFADLFKALEECAGNHSPDHTLFIGPPGIGKTHIMKLLADKLRRSRTLAGAYRLIIFPVDNQRITSLAFLLIEMVKILDDSEKGNHWLKLLETIDDEDENQIQSAVVEAFHQYHQKTGKRLLVLFENFDAFFDKTQSHKDTVDAFTGFLGNCGPTTFIGTACTSITDRSILKCKPYNHFNIVLIRELDLNQTYKLVYNHLKFDQQDEILSRFEDLAPRIQALHELTGGNPRLILLMYDLLTDESQNNIKSLFEDLLDRVTPYYYDRMRSLSVTDRAFLATLASLRSGYNTQSRLAKALRISPKQCNTIICRLSTLGYLESVEHPTIKRSKIYKIKEVFLDLWLAIGQLKDPKRFLPFLGEFLEKWYSDIPSREKKRQQLWMSLRISEAGEVSRDIESTENLLIFLSNIGNDKEICQNHLELSYHFVMTGRKQQCRKLLKSVNEIKTDDPVFLWITEKLDLLLKDGIANGFNQQLIDLFDCWKYERLRNFEQVVSQAIKISSYFDMNNRHELNIHFLNTSIGLLNDDIYRLPLYARIATAQEKEGCLDDAINSWEKVLAITDKTKDQKSKGTTLNNLSQVYQDRGEYPQAMKYLNQALEILQSINDYDGQSTTLNNIATVYFAQGYYENALEYFQKTLSIIQYTNDLPLKAITLSNISFIHKERGEYETAISDLEQSLSIMRKIGNRRGEATALINISQIYGDLGNIESCYQYFQPALKIMEEDRMVQSAFNALINIGKSCFDHNHQEMAISSWWLARKIASEHHLTNGLEKIGKLMQQYGIEELSPSSAFS